MYRRIVSVVLVGAGALLAFSPVGSAVEAHVEAAFADPIAPIPGPALPGPEPPQLSADEMARALDIARNDVAVKSLLAGRAYSPGKIGPWTTYRGAKIGAVMLLSLHEPATYAMREWPLLVYDESERSTPPYRQKSVRLQASNVRELMVWVDLNRSRIVGVDPGVGAQITVAEESARP
jgi:hypothetical protein